MTKPRDPKPVNIGRHEANCTICAHEAREQIEQEFVSWKSPVAIAIDHGLSDRATVYRHAHAFNLFAKRQRNVRAALEKIMLAAFDPLALGIDLRVSLHCRDNGRRSDLHVTGLFDESIGTTEHLLERKEPCFGPSICSLGVLAQANGAQPWCRSFPQNQRSGNTGV